MFCSGYKRLMVVLSKTKVFTVITIHLSNIIQSSHKLKWLLKPGRQWRIRSQTQALRENCYKYFSFPIMQTVEEGAQKISICNFSLYLKIQSCFKLSNDMETKATDRFFRKNGIWTAVFGRLVTLSQIQLIHSLHLIKPRQDTMRILTKLYN